MGVNIEVNNEIIEAKAGETILSALSRHGIRVPTLCSISDLSPTGACRMCVVEIEGRQDLVPACSFPVEQFMKIKTHSPRVINARKMIVELLLSNHPDDCLYCIRNNNCELQILASELNVRERRISGKKSQANLDQSSPGIIRDPAKCILCGRCVRICEEQQGVNTFDFMGRGSNTAIATAMNKDLNFSSCIHCGQCLISCPTGALHEKTNFDIVQDAINNSKIKVVVQYSPTVAVSLADEVEIRSGKDISGLLIAALRKIGFDRVYDTSFAIDILMQEQASELAGRIKSGQNLPLISSDCPAWVKFMEQQYPGLFPYMSDCKSPQQIMGTLSKKYLSEEENIPPDKIFSVSIMPCTAKKFEAQREEMTHKGVSDIDAVLTTREIAKLIKLYGIDIHSLEQEVADAPFVNASSSTALASLAGGMTEGILRNLHKQVTGKDMAQPKLPKLRGSKSVKQADTSIGKTKLKLAAVSGLKNAKEYIQDILEGKSKIDYLEVMACDGGCINGGGQPFFRDKKTAKSIMKTIHNADDKEQNKAAYQNQDIQNFCKKHLGEPLGKDCQRLIHTRFSERDVLL